MVMLDKLRHASRVISFLSGQEQMLRVEVKDLKEQSIVLHIDEHPAFFDLNDEDFLFMDRIRGDVEFQRLGDEIMAEGHLRATARTQCVRCLDATQITLKPEVHLTYSHDRLLLSNEVVVELGTQVPIYYNGEAINPRDDFRELILISLPNFPVCSQHCKGLCAECGANLNREPCRCSQKLEGSAEGWKRQLRNINFGESDVNHSR